MKNKKKLTKEEIQIIKECDEEIQFIKECNEGIYSYWMYHKSIDKIILVETGEQFVLQNDRNLEFTVFDLLENFNQICDTRNGELNKEFFKNNAFYSSKESGILIVRFLNDYSNEFYNTTVIIYQNSLEDNLAKYVLEYKKDNNLIQEEFISTNSLKQKIKDLNLRAFQISEKLLIGENIGWQSELDLYKLIDKWPKRFQFLGTFIEELSKLLYRTCKNKEYIDYYFLFNCLDTINYILISTPLQELDKKIIQFLNTINLKVSDSIIGHLEAEENAYMDEEYYLNNRFYLDGFI